MTVSQLLALLGIDPLRVAVEHNLVVVKRGTYGESVVNDGDEVEIVNFVGGGWDRAAQSAIAVTIAIQFTIHNPQYAIDHVL